MCATLPQELRVTRAIMEGSFLIHDTLTHIVFDSGASYFNIAQDFVLALGLTPVVLQIPLEITLLMARVIVLR